MAVLLRRIAVDDSTVRDVGTRESAMPLAAHARRKPVVVLPTARVRPSGLHTAALTTPPVTSTGLWTAQCVVGAGD